MGMSIDTPFIAHSELTDEIYVIDKKAKYCVTDQVMKAVVDTNRAIPKADYEARLKADLVAILEELDLQIDESAAYNLEVAKVQRLIRDRIDKLKESKE
jgi:hypothetical protein